jgi:hypothetical protein
MGSGSRYWVLRSLGRLSNFNSERVVEGDSSVTRASKQVQLRESGRGGSIEGLGRIQSWRIFDVDIVARSALCRFGVEHDIELFYHLLNSINLEHRRMT